jgi:hypothetical protein
MDGVVREVEIHLAYAALTFPNEVDLGSMCADETSKFKSILQIIPSVGSIKRPELSRWAPPEPLLGMDRARTEPPA